MKAKDIIRRHSVLKSERQSIEGMWKYMDQFVMPYRFEQYESKGRESSVNWRKRDIYDSTAPEAADALAASIQSNMISSSMKWFDYQFSDDDLNEDDAAKEWLQACGVVIYNGIQASTFNLAAAESLLDLVGHGSFALSEEVDEDEGELEFTSIPIGECCFEVGSKNQLLRFYRELKWTALQIVDKFGEDNLPSVVKKAYDDPAGLAKFTIIYCVYKREEKNLPDVNTSQFIAKRARPFGYKYVLEEGFSELGEEGGVYEMPVYFTRWRTTAGSIWGNGPGYKCLSTIMDVNECVELVLEAAALDAEPPMMSTQQGLISQLEWERGGLTIVNDMNDLAELPGRGNVQLASMEVEDMRESIRRCFYQDQLKLKDSPQMTAEEVRARIELMFRLLGPTGGRIKSDWLDPMMNRTFSIYYRLGKLPPVPASVREKQAEYNVEYIGPLPRSQKVQQANDIAGFAGQVGNLAQIKPDVMDIPDWDALVRGLGELSGVQAKYLRSVDQIKEIRDERAAKVEKMEQTQQTKEEGEAAQSVVAAAAGAEALQPESIAALQGAVNGQ